MKILLVLIFIFGCMPPSKHGYEVQKFYGEYRCVEINPDYQNLTLMVSSDPVAVNEYCEAKRKGESK